MAAYENYYDAETVFSAAATTRGSEHSGFLPRRPYPVSGVPGAVADFNCYLRTDMPGKYTVTVSSASGTATPPNLTVVGTVTYPTLFSQYGFGNVTFNFTVKATNYRIE